MVCSALANPDRTARPVPTFEALKICRQTNRLPFSRVKIRVAGGRVDSASLTLVGKATAHWAQRTGMKEKRRRTEMKIEGYIDPHE
jgi:hypothetical protein